jgi:puromycin-sensitive aminopeptidase
MAELNRVAEKKDWERLAKSFTPYHYDIHITPDLPAHTFKGKVHIKAKITEEIKIIKLNSADLIISSAQISQDNHNQTAGVEYDKGNELIILNLDKSLSSNKEATVIIEYSGILNDKMHGFYRSAYKNDKGVDKLLAVTQFESTDARRAVPCSDEPAIKATFSVSLSVPKGLIAISNMPELSKNESQGLVTYVFDKTPIMSTYLLAWAVGEFEMIEAKTKEGLLVRCFTTEGKIDQAKFSLDVAVRVMPFYNKW